MPFHVFLCKTHLLLCGTKDPGMALATFDLATRWSSKMAVEAQSECILRLQLTKELHGRGHKIIAACRKASPELSAIHSIQIVEGTPSLDLPTEDMASCLPCCLHLVKSYTTLSVRLPHRRHLLQVSMWQLQRGLRRC